MNECLEFRVCAQQLRGVVVLNPSWLIDLLATIMTTRHNYTKDGILKKSSLPHIWKPPRFPEQMYPFMVSLLDSFEVSFDISDKVSHDAAESPEELREAADSLRLIPSLLPEDPPPELSALWPVERHREGGALPTPFSNVLRSFNFVLLRCFLALC